MIIAVNTATPQFSLALLKDSGEVVAEHFMSPGSKSFGDFMPAMDFLLMRCEAGLHEIEGLVVSLGPGSFTGLRVGLSAAKGMAEALGIPVVGVSSLEALASQFPFTPHPVCPLLSARRGEVFAALFAWRENQGWVRQREDTSVKFDELASFVEGVTLFVGTDHPRQAAEVTRVLGPGALLAPTPFWNLRASRVGDLGLERYRKGNFDDVENLVPAYLRPPDIRPNPYPLLSGRSKPLQSGTLTKSVQDI